MKKTPKDEIRVIMLDDGSKWVSITDLLKVAEFTKKKFLENTSEVVTPEDSYYKIEEASKEREIYERLMRDLIEGLEKLNGEPEDFSDKNNG